MNRNYSIGANPRLQAEREKWPEVLSQRPKGDDDTLDTTLEPAHQDVLEILSTSTTNISRVLSMLQSNNLEFSIDQIHQYLHATNGFVEVADKYTQNVIEVAAKKLEERQTIAQNSSEAVDMIKVLRGISQTQT